MQMHKHPVFFLDVHTQAGRHPEISFAFFSLTWMHMHRQPCIFLPCFLNNLVAHHSLPMQGLVLACLMPAPRPATLSIMTGPCSKQEWGQKVSPKNCVGVHVGSNCLSNVLWEISMFSLGCDPLILRTNAALQFFASILEL